MTPWYLPAIRFSLQLLVSEIPFFWALKPRKGIWWRAIVSTIAYVFAAIGIRWLNNNVFQGGTWLSFLYYLTVFGMTFLIMFCCFETKWKGYLFVGVAGYAMEHVAFCISTIIKYYVTQSIELNTVTDHIFFRILPYIIVDFIVYYLLVRPGLKRGILEHKNFKMTIVSALILCACLLLSVFVGIGTFVEDVICRSYGAICCSLGVFLQFNFNYTDKLEQDNLILEQLIHTEQKQNEMKKDVVDMINIKCHDIKYRLGSLSTLSEDERQKIIKEMQESVMIYDSIFKTGNDALDLTLTEKSMVCNKHNIIFTCIADGSKLEFMNSADVSSLFGNALDNAIESLLHEENEEKRFISLRISGTESMLFINMENYCSSPLSFDDGLPQTTKDDKAYHGFGTKSMRYIATKYGGEMRTEQKENIFFLDFYFPLKPLD